MGERLATCFVDKDGNRFLTIYQHWSAYTLSALETVKDVISEYERLKESTTDIKLLALRICDSLNYKICDGKDAQKQIDEIKKKYPHETFYNLFDVEEGDPNFGVIGFEQYAEELESCCSNTTEIDLTNEGVDFDCYNWYNDIEEAVELKNAEIEMPCNIPFNIGYFYFDEVDEVYKVCEWGQEEDKMFYSGDVIIEMIY